MRVRLVLGLLVLGALALASSAQAQIYAQPLDMYGQSGFVYNNYAYLPLQSVTDFIGADIGPGEYGASFVISLDGDTLGLIPGSTQAYFNGSPVTLPVPPFDINGVTMVPVSLFHDYFYTDIDWQPSMNRVFIYGPGGWGYGDVLVQPPAYALPVIQSYGVPFYGPSAFYYDGVPFVSFLDWDDFFGIPIFFEPDRDDFVAVYGGRELVFAPGSPYVFYGRERYVLPAAPVFVNNRLYMPANFFALPPINAPIQVIGNTIRVQGRTGVRQARIDPRVPARMTVTPPPARQLAIPVRPAVIPGVVTPTPRPSVQALHPRVPPRSVAVTPTPQLRVVQPPTTAARPTAPRTAVRPTPPPSAVRPTPPTTAVRPAPPTAVRPMPPTTAVRPLPPTTAARPLPPTTAVRPLPPTAVRPTPPRVAVAPTPQVREVRPPVTQARPAPRPAAPPTVAQRPVQPQARPTVPALRPGVPREQMRQQARGMTAPPRQVPQVQQRPAPPRAPEAQQRPAPGRPQAQGTPAPQRGGQGQARGRQQNQG